MKMNGNWKQGIYLSSGHGDVLNKCSILTLRNNEYYHTEWFLKAQFRCEIIPLRVETGRYRNEHLQEHCCVLCTKRSIEDETDFLFNCNYENNRYSFFQWVT